MVRVWSRGPLPAVLLELQGVLPDGSVVHLQSQLLRRLTWEYCLSTGVVGCRALCRFGVLTKSDIGMMTSGEQGSPKEG